MTQKVTRADLHLREGVRDRRGALLVTGGHSSIPYAKQEDPGRLDLIGPETNAGQHHFGREGGGGNEPPAGQAYSLLQRVAAATRAHLRVEIAAVAQRAHAQVQVVEILRHPPNLLHALACGPQVAEVHQRHRDPEEALGARREVATTLLQGDVFSARPLVYRCELVPSSR